MLSEQSAALITSQMLAPQVMAPPWPSGPCLHTRLPCRCTPGRSASGAARRDAARAFTRLAGNVTAPPYKPAGRGLFSPAAASAAPQRGTQRGAHAAAEGQGLLLGELARRWQAISRASVHASTGLWAALGLPPLVHNIASLAAGQTGALVDQGWLVRAAPLGTAQTLLLQQYNRTVNKQ